MLRRIIFSASDQIAHLAALTSSLRHCILERLEPRQLATAPDPSISYLKRANKPPINSRNSRFLSAVQAFYQSKPPERILPNSRVSVQETSGRGVLYNRRIARKSSHSRAIGGTFAGGTDAGLTSPLGSMSGGRALVDGTAMRSCKKGATQEKVTWAADVRPSRSEKAPLGETSDEDELPPFRYPGILRPPVISCIMYAVAI